MLTELRIKNFIIIEDLTISFTKGLNILTGETGAGKSILIDAISGVLGEKMTTDMIRSGFEKATLEGVFDIANIPQMAPLLDSAGIDNEEDTLILKRELYSSGRGRSFINATQVPVSKLREVSEYLLDIHGQNEHQNIVKVAKHRELLDSFAGLIPEVEGMRSLHGRLNEIRERLESFEIDEKEKARRIEFNTFAVREIESVNPVVGEEDELKNESNLLANAEKLFREINTSSELLGGDGGVLQKLAMSEQGLSRVSEYDPEISGSLDAIREALYSLEDVSSFLKGYESSIDYSPERINRVEERLAKISGLKKKYGDTVEEILEYAEKARRELENINSSEEQLESLKAEFRKTAAEAKQAALALSAKREEAARRLEALVMKELGDLGMPDTVFKISLTRDINPIGEIEENSKRYSLYPYGLDKVEFLLSANAGEDLRQLRKVASGGEMSRIMLALKNVLLSRDIVESLIFDEVDAGISGKIAEIVGKKLKLLAKDRQVLVITHLPQIAAMSDRHFSVQKSKTGDRITTIVRELNQKDKVKEVARLLAGETVTELSVRHAEEMVATAER